MVVDEVPAEAQEQLNAMFAEAESVKAPVAATPAAAAAPAKPVLTPVQQCAVDFKEMPSNAFRAKYFNDTRLRPIFDEAEAQGLL
jgi:hypothetical protein